MIFRLDTSKIFTIRHQRLADWPRFEKDGHVLAMRTRRSLHALGLFVLVDTNVLLLFCSYIPNKTLS